MNYELALCARVVRTGDVLPALKFGITDKDFTSEEAARFWRLIMQYHTAPATRGSIIAETQLHNWFHDYTPYDDLPKSTIEALCAQVRRGRILTACNAAIDRFITANVDVMEDPTPLLAKLQREVSDLIALGTTANTDLPIQEGLMRMLRKMQSAEDGQDQSCMDWPWEPLNDATFGLQIDDYVVLYGRPKSMKSWVLAFLIAWAFDQEKRVLVYTKEMTPDNIYMRVFGCLCKLPYDDLRATTSVAQWNNPSRRQMLLSTRHKLAQYAADIRPGSADMNRLIVLSGKDVSAGGDTVSWLASKVEQYKPTILFVDGLYLLSDQRKATSDHVRVMNISRDLRNLVLQTGVPLIATVQANRKAAAHSDANLDEIAYSDALAQDATIAARVINDKVTPTISLVIAGSREFHLHGLRINAVPATDFSYHSVLTEKEIEKAKEGDQAEVEKKDKKSKARAPAKPGPGDPVSMSELTDAALKSITAHQ